MIDAKLTERYVSGNWDVHSNKLKKSHNIHKRLTVFLIDLMIKIDTVLGCIPLTVFRNRNTYNDDKKSFIWGFWGHWSTKSMLN